MKIILASQSPRRKALLSKIIDKFEIILSDVEENIKEFSSPLDFAIKVALSKGMAVYEKIKNKNEKFLILSADTIVTYKNKIYGKPKDFNDMKNMLLELSNKKHQVITGFALIDNKKNIIAQDYASSDVFIKNLKNLDFKEYFLNSNCMDKAGAYGIQDMKTFENNNVTGNTTKFDIVDHYSGDYDNIVGLPITKIKKYFKF